MPLRRPPSSLLASLVFAVAGCGEGAPGEVGDLQPPPDDAQVVDLGLPADGPPGDLARRDGPRDLATRDLATRDLAMRDLVIRDLAARDLAMAIDQRIPDLGGADLARTDLARLPDLPRGDLAQPPPGPLARLGFFAIPAFRAGYQPRAMVARDWNGDGRLDLAVLAASDGMAQNNGIAILLGTGDGSFLPARYVLLPAAATAGGLAAGDWNGDGKIDLAAAMAAWSGNDVAVLLGKGDGSFGGVATVATGSAPHGITAGDLNGDGRDDLVVANSKSNDLTILLARPDGSFPAAAALPIGQAPERSLAADLDQDGDLDLAVTLRGEQAVTILLGKGDGSFTAGASYKVGVAPEGIAGGDFDGDGKRDLAVALHTNTPAASLVLLPGHGDGSFRPAVPFAGGYYPTAIAAGDLDGDGRLDVAVSGSGGHFVGGQGDGTFRAAIDFPVAAGNQNDPGDVALGDWNGDGRTDLALLDYYSGFVALVLALPGGRFQSAPVSPLDGSRALVLDDWNGDGRLDVVAAPRSDFASRLTVGLGQRDGTFLPASSPPVGTAPWAVVKGDLDGDGRRDLAGIAGGRGFAALARGNGGFRNPVLYPTTTTAGSAAALGDLDGDGKLDLALLAVGDFGMNHGLSILLGRGSGAFGPPSLAAPIRGYALAIGDLDGDNHADVVVSGGGAGITTLLGLGDGTLQAPRTSNLGLGDGFGNWSRLVLADFDGDGKLDVVANSPALGKLSVGLGKGDGGFGPAATYTVGGSPQAVAVGDLDRDGRLDLAVPCYYGFVAFLLGRGDGTFGAPIYYATTYGWAAVQLGDLDGDGRLDVVLGIGSQLEVLQNHACAKHADCASGYCAGSVCRAPLSCSDGMKGGGESAVDCGGPFCPSCPRGAGCLQAGDCSTLACVAGSCAAAPACNDNLKNGGESDVDCGGLACGRCAVGRLCLGAGDCDSGHCSNGRCANKGLRLAFGPRLPVGFNVGAAVLAGGDVNRDGKSDLVAGGFQGGNVQVALGNGNGSFAIRPAFAAGGTPVDLQLGELSGDGRLDLVVAPQGLQSYGVLLGNGDGTFQGAMGQGLPGAAGPLLLGDANRDGRVDLLGTVPGLGLLAALVGDGAGAFKGPLTSPSVKTPSLVGLAAGDLDGDQRLELVTGGGSALVLHRGAGDGTFAPFHLLATGSSYVGGPLLVDLDTDGRLDLVVPTPYSSQLEIYAGLGDGSFATSALLVVAGAPNASVVRAAAGDLDRDGRPDLLVTTGGDLQIFAGRGDGTFRAPLLLPEGGSPGAMVLGDWNGDNQLDVAVGLGQSGAVVHLNQSQ